VNKLTDGQTNRLTDKQSDKLTDRQADRLTNRQTDKLTDRLEHRQTDRLTGKQTNWQADRLADRQNMLNSFHLITTSAVVVRTARLLVKSIKFPRPISILSLHILIKFPLHEHAELMVYCVRK
jgi:hypothetical protein